MLSHPSRDTNLRRAQPLHSILRQRKLEKTNCYAYDQKIIGIDGKLLGALLVPYGKRTEPLY